MRIKDILEEAAKNLPAKNNRDIAVRGGNSGIYKNGVNYAESAGSCFRMISLRAHGLQEPLDLRSHMTFKLGFAWEALFEELLKASPEFSDVQSQVVVEEPGAVPWRGTADFVAIYKGKPILFDSKSVTSMNSYTKYLIDNKPNTAYVAQLARYMLAMNIYTAYLVYGAFLYVGKAHVTSGQWDKMGFSPASPTVSQTLIEIRGTEIYIEDVLQSFGTEDILAHTKHAQHLLANSLVEIPRPVSTGGLPPCAYCHFRRACLRFEQENQPTEALGAFLAYAKAEI